jgi:hypothetical protein
MRLVPTRAAAGVLTLGVLLTAVTGVRAADGCKDVAGTFTAVAPATCASPIGLCTQGQLVGGLEATYEFVGDTSIPIDFDPLTVVYTGHSVITTKAGAVLYGQDTGIMFFNPDGTADFVTTVDIAGGTRQYQRATGELIAPGVLDLATGDTVGTYSGTICKHVK